MCFRKFYIASICLLYPVTILINIQEYFLIYSIVCLFLNRNDKEIFNLTKNVILNELLILFTREVGISKFYPLSIFIHSIVLLYANGGLKYLKENFKITFSKNIVYTALLQTLIYSFILIIWFIYFSENIYIKRIPSVPVYLLFVLMIGFSILNAFSEEIKYRIVFFDNLLKVDQQFANLVQAIWFSVIHYHYGFPNNILGLIITFSLGYALGKIRLKQKSIFWPFMIHIIIDLLIISLVVIDKFF